MQTIGSNKLIGLSSNTQLAHGPVDFTKLCDQYSHRNLLTYIPEASTDNKRALDLSDGGGRKRRRHDCL